MRRISLITLAVLSLQVSAKSIDNFETQVAGEVLVKIKTGHMGKFLAKKSLMGLDVRKELHLLTGDYLVIKGNDSVASMLTDLKSMDEVTHAEPNYQYRVNLEIPKIQALKDMFGVERQSNNSPTDPLFQWQWGLRNTGSNEPVTSASEKSHFAVAGADMNAENAWALSKGSRRIVVGVVDSGVDVNHPDLKNNIWINTNEIPDNGKDDDKNGYVDDVNGWSGLTSTGNVTDGTGHGTHCAGTIGAEHDNGIGIAGIMPEVSLMALKFIDSNGFGSTADAIAAIDYGIRMNVDVLSNSWGGGPYSKALEDIIKKARDRGIIFVAASGNNGMNNDQTAYYPANYNFSNVIAVGNHTAEDTISQYSNYGTLTVQVAAPGTKIISTAPGGKYDVRSGTSMAAPHVAGAIGLLLSQEGKLPVEEIRRRLMSTSMMGPNYSGKVSAGRINLYNLLTK